MRDNSNNQQHTKPLSELGSLFELLSHKMAHNLRTPLVSIKAGLSVIKDSFPALAQTHQFAIENGCNTQLTYSQLTSFAQCLSNCENELHAMNNYLNLLIENLKNATTLDKANQLLTIERMCEKFL